jgi:Cys-tRNA(Pro)/Cys-tRNA(Cys) deacylase
MTTRGIQFLVQHQITHDVLAYDHQQKGAAFASQATGFALAQTIKTLVVETGNHSYWFALMPGDQNISFKKLAKACKAKRAALADAHTAERLTGYQVGGISPFGARKSLPVVMDARLADSAEVAINAGRRGILVVLDPQNIITLLQPLIFSIAA